jgi:hypothetical protein
MTIPVGVNFLSRIERGLTECVGAIYLISPASVARSWINFELGAVWIRSVIDERRGRSGVPTIPICHSGCTPDKLPTPLNNLNAIPGTQPRQLERAFRSIQLAVGGRGMLKTDFSQLASKVAALEKEGSGTQEQQAQAPTRHSRVTKPSTVNPGRHYSPTDKDRIAEAFYQLRETLNNEADPLQLDVQRLWQFWNQRKSQTQPSESLDIKGTIDRMNSIRQSAAQLSHKLFNVILKENINYESLLKTVLNYQIPDPFRKLQEHADRLRDALRSADAIYQESPHHSDRIVEVVIKILEPFAETNSRLTGWIHDTLRRVKEQEEVVLSKE